MKSSRKKQIANCWLSNVCDWLSRNAQRATRNSREAGNVVFTLFGAVAVVGAIGAGSVAVLQGPVSSMVKSNQKTMTDTRMELNTRLVLKQAIDLGVDADCDDDNYIEAPAWQAGTGPTGGGILPTGLSTVTTDPWGGEYGYCVWDHGSVTVADADADCGGAGANRLEGADTALFPYVAIISSGPDRTFQTTCSDWVDVAPADGIPDTPLLVKTSGSDDLIFDYTYSGAEAALGDYWIFTEDSDTGTETVLSSDISLDFGGDVTFGGLVDLNKLGGGLVLSDMATAVCTATEDGQLFLDLTQTPPSVVMCDGAGTFEAISGGTGSGGGINNPIGHWKMEETTGTTIVDSGSGGNDGTFSGEADVTSNTTTGQNGKALNFDGTDDEIDTAENAAFSPANNPVTISFWAKVPSSAAAQGNSNCGAGGRYAVAKGSSGGGWEWGFDFDNNNYLCMAVWQNGGAGYGKAEHSMTLNDGLWHYYAGVIESGSAISLYVDGTNVDTMTPPFAGVLTDGSQALQIGRRGDGNFFLGQIDDVRIYDRALSASEVANLYTTTATLNNSIAAAAQDEDPNITYYVCGADDSDKYFGNGATGNSLSPVVPNEHIFIRADSGNDHACGVKKDGTAWCWGSNDTGRLGNGGTVKETFPVQVADITNFTHVDAGRHSSCGLTSSGTIYCWGRDDFGQLADNNLLGAGTSVPVQIVSNVTNFATLSSFGNGYCALTDDNVTWCWGEGTGGQLGDGNASNSDVPVQVANITDFVNISGGGGHTCGLRKNGEIWCWGVNGDGQLGDGTTTNSNVPVKVNTDLKFTQVSVDGDGSCALSVDKKIYCWGSDSFSAMGNGAGGDQLLPGLIDDAEQDYVLVSKGNSIGVGIKSDGRAFSWGFGGASCDGDGNADASPEQVPNVTDFYYINASYKTFYMLAKTTSPGGIGPVAPYEIKQVRNAGNTVGSHALAVQLNSTTGDAKAGIGFVVDATSTGDADTLTASIEAIRKGTDGTGGMVFGANSPTGYNRALYLDPDGDLQIGSSVTDDVLAGLQLGTHDGAHGGWAADYHIGMLTTCDSCTTNNIAYFGLNSTTGDAVVLANKDVFIEHSNDDGTTVNSVLHLQDTGASTFFGALELDSNVTLNIEASTDTAGQHAMYKFERYGANITTAPANADDAGGVVFEGYDGTALSTSGYATIRGEISAGPAVNNVPIDIVIGVDNAGDAKANETLRVASDGKVAIGGVAAPDNLLHVGGRMVSDAGVKVSTDANCANATDEGTIRFDSGSLQYCDGTTWQPFSTSACSEEGVSFYSLSTNGTFACGVYSNGQVACWGGNGNGQHGGTSTADPQLSLVPIPEASLSGAVEISIGSAYACARLENGRVKCWGDNVDGQLGNGNTVDQSYPTDVIGISGAIDIDSGGRSTCAVASDGLVRCWGKNLPAQGAKIGTSVGGPHTEPFTVNGVVGAIQVAVGAHTTCALLANGTAQCWGDDSEESLGDGAGTTDSILPVEVSGLTGGRIIDGTSSFAGDGSTFCAVKDDGTIWCWGDNDNGEIDGSNIGTDQAVATQVTGVTGAVDVAVGRGHTCAVINDGTVQCWGRNSDGQIGNGASGADVTTPTTVNNISTAVKVYAGRDNSCALLSDGSAMCWGDDLDGQSGDGTATGNNLNPVTVINPLGGCAPKFMFSTSTTHDGNLGGLTGADAICQSLADAAGLPGTYMAWLSDSTDSPNTRFTQSQYGYMTPTGGVIATSYADLLDSILDAPVNVSETGGAVGNDTHYTGTEADGNAHFSGQDCTDWTSNASPGEGAAIGRGQFYGNRDWTLRGIGADCSSLYSLYCFQQ